MDHLNPVAADFIRFCVMRSGAEWPALYDEMCRVAARRLYLGMGYTELNRVGLSFSLNSLDRTFNMVTQVTTSIAF